MDETVDHVATAVVKARYNRNAWWYDARESLVERAFRPWRENLWRLAAGRILEVGVGTGKNFPYYPRGAPIIAIDLADRMLGRAVARARRFGLSVDLREGDVQALKFPDDSFDTAVATFVFCSVPNPVRGLRELGRVVNSDGRILLLEHVRVDHPVIGRVQDLFNPLVYFLSGVNINRSTADNAVKAGLVIECIEHLGFMGMFKLIVARPSQP